MALSRFPWTAAALTLLCALASAGCARGGKGAQPVRAADTPRSEATAAVRFVDVAKQAGLNYRWQVAGKRPLNILQTIGNGCAFLDYDNDGNLDILLVGPKPALYKGDGKGRFTDTSAATGLSRFSGHFLGCAVGDCDNDGWDDLYLSGYRTGILLRNRNGRAFADVTAGSGLRPQPWGTSCAFAETIPGTGRLDLYVANYADFGPATRPQLCRDNGVLTSCGPRYYKPVRGVLYRSRGGLRFADVTSASGASAATGKGLGVAWADFENSGLPGLALANDEMPGDLLRPVRGKNGDVAYQNVGELSGTAYDRDGNVHGGMGTDWGDSDNDGRLDLFVATFSGEAKCLYRNDGGGSFSDVALAAGLSPATPNVAFGVKFFDYDNDGWLDLAITNGHVQDNIDKINSGATYRQPAQLFHNRGGARVGFEEVSGRAGADLQRPLVGRGLAVGDYDNDGRLDLLLVDSEGAPLLLHNESGPVGHWLGVRLVGARSNRNGYGALLTAAVGERRLLRPCQSGGSYLSASDARVHFGLGAATRVDKLTVRWPGGRTDTYNDLSADRYLTLREGDPTPR